MPRYRITSSQVCYYTDYIEAENEDEATEIFWEDGTSGDSDYGELEIDEISEDTDYEVHHITGVQREQDENIRR